MKKVIIALSAVVFSAAAANANVIPSYSFQEKADEKVAVKLEELPEAVKAAISGDSYKGWAAESAVYNKTKDVYEVTVKKDAETKVLTFSKDGKAVE